MLFLQFQAYIERAKMKKENNTSIFFRAWSSQKLDIGVRWLLRKCGVPQTECRHMCMKLVYQLCPLVQSKCLYVVVIFVHHKQNYRLT